MNSSIELGPLLIKESWIVLSIASILGYLLLAYFSSLKGKAWKPFREQIGNGIIFFIVFYMFGSIIFNLPMFLTDPLAVLSYPSGKKELYLAFVVLTIYWTVMSLKTHIPLSKYLHASLYILLPAKFGYAFFEGNSGEGVGEYLAFIVPWTHHPVSLYSMVISGGLLIWLITMKNTNEGKKTGLLFMLWVFSEFLINMTLVFPQFFGIPVTLYFYLFLFGLGVYYTVFNQINFKKVF